MNSNQSEQSKGNILIVDDLPDNLRVLSKALTEQGYKVRSVINGAMALRVARSTTPDLILLDIRMPDLDGYEVCEKLKASPRTREIPIIFLSALDEAIDKVKAFQVGGADYVTKPFQFEEVLTRVEHQIQLQAAKSEIKILNQQLELRVIQRTAQLEKEIVKRQVIQEKLLHMALHDPLTELPNRTWLIKRLEQFLARLKQHPDYLFAVLFLDCDRFKVVNDSLGHLVGDQLLISLARRLESCLSPEHTISRFGGDEFVIILDKINDLSQAVNTAKRLQTEMDLPFNLDRHEIYLNASIGIVLGSKDYQEPYDLLRDADLALYQAKATGRGCYQVFNPMMHTLALQRLELETELRRALERQEFVVYYQPIVSLITEQITGFEALVRWLHPQRGLLSPGWFIPTAEETKLIIDIDLLVLRQACHQLNFWQNQISPNTRLTMSSNLSVQQFSQNHLIDNLDQILQQTKIDSQSLKLEITENAILENSQSAKTILQAIQERKIKIGIDDFGTGYSSLSYLHRFPLDTLKIDRFFIQHIGAQGENLEIVKTIIDLAHNLGMDVVAEGIEKKQQLDYLKALGCEFGQGYFFSRPLDSRAATAKIT